jgi:hypothetical protein
MFVINFNDKTVAEFNEQELSRLLNRFFGNPLQENGCSHTIKKQLQR